MDEEVIYVRAEVAQRWGRVAGFPRCLFLNGFGSVDPVCGFLDRREESWVVPGGIWAAVSGSSGCYDAIRCDGMLCFEHIFRIFET
jgi:hypothetical protein